MRDRLYIFKEELRFAGAAILLEQLCLNLISGYEYKGAATIACEIRECIGDA